MRETIVKIPDFAFILEIEPPRREIKDQINIAWLIKEQWLDLPIIHICIDLDVLKNIYQSESTEESIALKNKVFMSRTKYSNKWEQFSIIRYPGLSRHYINNYCNVSRLFVNGYAIKVTDLFYWVSGAKSNFIPEYQQLSSQFEIVYLLTSVNKKVWLLVEEYLKELVKAATKLKNGERYVEKLYISPRKYIVPTKVNSKLDNIGYSVWIPFGMNEKYPTFETAKEEIKYRLQEAGLPGLKLTFRKESIAK